jgi:hypothetical protein
LSGLRSYSKAIIEAYNSNGINAIVIDWGYLKRVFGSADFNTKYWQVGINKLNWLYPDQCSTDRLDQLNITIKQPIVNAGRDVKLVCGQYPNDPSHDMDNHEMQLWAESIVEELKGLTTDKIIWRPHPAQIEIENRYVPCRNADEVSVLSLQEDLTRANLVITYRSNVGHDALIAGIPVYCDTGAMYSGLCRKDLVKAISSKCPAKVTREKYFARVAYSQWTLDEINSGEPFVAMEKLMWR